jgi:DNA-directed RNA polymerase subunit F
MGNAVDLHVPEAPIRSLKDLLVHIGIVTIGILIALGLEQLVEARHHARLAAEALDSFRRELADNRSEVDEEIKAMAELRQQIAVQIANLAADRPQPFKSPGIAVNLTSTASWDTAIATQALVYLPYEQVHAFAEAFDVARLFYQSEQAGLRQWQEMNRFGTDVAAMSPEQRRQLLEELRRYESYSYLVEFAGKGALRAFENALKSS